MHDLSLIAERGEPPAERAQRLMEEARAAASEHISLLEHALMVVGKLSEQIAVGGEIYPIGIRELSRKMAEDAVWCAQTCASIQKNRGAPGSGRHPAFHEGEQVISFGRRMEPVAEPDVVLREAAVG